VLSSLSAASQDLDNVTISGKVTDQNGAVIPGATITAKLVDTKVERAAVTDGDGNYKIIQLAPGKYTLTAVANSFQTTVESGLEFTAGRNAQIDLILFPPGLKLDTVVITTEDASPVDVTRTVVGGTVKTREIENLPVASRHRSI
jgi:protocatechuate 3,4-dioxygenase beta subunit